jgi:hypothetical protein
MSNYYGSTNIVEKLFSVYISEHSISYSHLKNVEELELVAFAYGIASILGILNIDPKEIIYDKTNLKDSLTDIIKNKFLMEKKSDFVYDKDNVNI